MHKNFFFRKKFFDPKNLEKRDFWAQKSLKMAHLVSTPQRVILHESLKLKFFSIKFSKQCTKIFFRKIFLTPKTSKNVIFGPKNREKWQSQKILVGIDSGCFETCSKTEISKLKKFSHYKIFSWDLVIFCPI